jgi:uncharacterized protein
MSLELRLLTGEPEEMAALQRVIEGAPVYTQRITGYPPGPADAQSLMTGCPPDVEHADKFVWGITREGGMIGCADVIRGWPSADTAHIGLLLLTESYHGRGLGRRAYEAIEAQTRRWPPVRTLRLAVVATNAQVLPFWHRMGFTETGEVRPYRYDKLTSESIILTKFL